MSRIKVSSILDDVLKRVDELNWSIPDLADQAGLHRTTIYHMINGKHKTTDRETVRCLADALGMKVKMEGSLAKLYVEGRIEAKRVQAGVHLGNEGIADMLKTMNTQQLEAVDEMVRIIALMDGEEIVDLLKVCNVLAQERNKQQFLRRLKAIAELILPFEVLKEDGDY